MNRTFVYIILCLLVVSKADAQYISGYGTDGSRQANIYTAVPFLLIMPHPRSGGMGNAGVALSGDANSTAINTAALAFLPTQHYGFSVNYSPWLKQLVPDMSISYLSGYYRLNERSTVSASLRYFSIGNVSFSNENSQELGTYSPNESAFDIGYSLQLGPEFALGGNLRYINSNLLGGGSISSRSSGSGNAVAADISGLYRTEVALLGTNSSWSVGLSLSNIGTKLVYGNTGKSFFLPANFKMGSALQFGKEESRVTIALDLNKLMVPTQPIYDQQGNIIKGKDPERSVPSGIFGSFADAPGGFKEELKEVGISTGAEFSFKEKFFFRVGYCYQHPDKGNISYLTTGLGFKYNVLSLDLSYLIGTPSNNPMANTLRFGLQANFGNTRQK
ncbi:type IX secretion system outer membrane channel protein PorV [Pedobacter sp. MR2016-19]|uniref:type IX secretion system outer membrane channel protein PorV n=1 Tax=Pedobacter sp. MR2016-19 TaxID=2780089 RepID=UPI0018753287|nr:type IX secretion system outer membrane channel protein PorV [Pedobacter sp. MR2016-19]MBE5320013.1 type IX secretion system outer membrane channel protein PorV [Pedobacter sp. MR2016-19]